MGLFEKIKAAFKEEGLTEELCEHLRQIDVRATVIDTKSPEAVHHKPTLGIFGNPPLGCVKIEGKNIDLVEFYRMMTSGRGTSSHSQGPGQIIYYYYYVVRADVGDKEDDLKAEVKKIEKGLIKKEVVDFEWKGKRLAQLLGADSTLRNMLLDAGMPHLAVMPNKKDGCIAITATVTVGGVSAKYDLTVGRKAFPTREAFEIYDRIAKHIHNIIDTPKT